MQATFLYSPGSLLYTFGPSHPYNSERLRRTVLVLEHFKLKGVCGARPATEAQLKSLHGDDYIDILMKVSEDPTLDIGYSIGLSNGDTPAFEGMYEAACNVAGGTIEAAESVLCGDTIAFHLAGGLHHSQKHRASGFCFINDIALGINVLKAKYKRIAYVDIDLHHGDGVEAIFHNDPGVLTVSIHQFGKGFYPGTGNSDDTDDHGTVVNIPLKGGTGGDTWLRAFRDGVMPALEIYKPEVIVLQMGVDAHMKDPLGTLRIRTQDWYEAVKAIRDFGAPIVALGGGGYFPANPPRMWTAAVHILLNEPLPASMPQKLVNEWKTAEFDFIDPDSSAYCDVMSNVGGWGRGDDLRTPSDALNRHLKVLRESVFERLQHTSEAFPV